MKNKNYLQKMMLALWPVFSLISVSDAQDHSDTIVNVYFENNWSVLKPAEINRLNMLLMQGFEVEKIIGYTDTVGTIDYNLSLSRRRAESVSALLLKEGWEGSSGIMSYKGEYYSEGISLGQCRKVELTMRHPAEETKVKPAEEAKLKSAEETIVKLAEETKVKPVEEAIANPAEKAIVNPAEEASVNQEELKDTMEIPMDNVYFFPDRAILAPESIDYVEKLADRLLQFKRYKLLIVGHVNYQGNLSSEANGLFKLSEERAKLLFGVFLEHGFPAANMTYKGVGNSEPANSDPKSYEEKTRNMRVRLFLTPG